MPPETAMMVAQRALEAARTAETAAKITSSQVEGLRAEVRGNFVNLEERQKDFWGYVKSTLDTQSKMLRDQNENFDAFKSELYVDIDRLEGGRKKHHHVLFGDPDRKDDCGLTKRVDAHDGHITRGIWTIGIITTLATAFWGYMLIFHLEDMKRGIFNSAEEDQIRVIRREVIRMVPSAKWPSSGPTKNPDKPDAS